MIDTLVDLFLLISTDKKSISCYNMSTFYQFITKKIPEIENQRSNLISCFINQKIFKNDNNNNNEKSHQAKINRFIYKNEENISKITRDITIKNFQNELLSLYNDMLDYLYEENIIILSDIQKNILENKINKKLIEKKELYPGSYRLNNFVIKIIKKTEIRNYLIELINNNFVSFTFTIKDFINFFNSKNTKKNRDISETFVKLMNSIIKIYNVDKKILHAKKVSKTKTKSLGKIPVISINNNNILKEKSIKNKYTKKYINQFFHKINNSFNNKKGEHFNLNNNCIKKKKRKSTSKKNNNQINTKETKNEDNNNLTQDTIPCQTLNNCYSLDKISKNCIYDNYLNNVMKNKRGNIKKNVLFSEQNLKSNDLQYYCSKSQIDKATTTNIITKKKVSKSALFNKNICEFINNTYNNKNEIEIDNDNKIGRKNKLFFSYENQSENIFNEKNKGCIIN